MRFLHFPYISFEFDAKFGDEKKSQKAVKPCAKENQISNSNNYGSQNISHVVYSVHIFDHKNCTYTS